MYLNWFLRSDLNIATFWSIQVISFFESIPKIFKISIRWAKSLIIQAFTFWFTKITHNWRIWFPQEFQFTFINDPVFASISNMEKKFWIPVAPPPPPRKPEISCTFFQNSGTLQNNSRINISYNVFPEYRSRKFCVKLFLNITERFSKHFRNTVPEITLETYETYVRLRPPSTNFFIRPASHEYSVWVNT